ncbi:LCP family protein [Selenomonadales bacterium OttesenSCG-928-I06]|nr:LCP family protein [Selenomonadales bacterium OttesenSCG-928-I06]
MSGNFQQKLKESRKKNIDIKKYFAGCLIIITLLVVTLGAAFYWASKGMFQRADNNDDDGAVNEVYEYDFPNKINILVLGVDERKEDVGRSDTMFVVMIDTVTKDVSLLSIPRDTRVRIPGYGWDKVNHAYAHGEVPLTKKTIEAFLGVPMDYYVKIDFKGFYKIIDALGGVTINVERPMYYEDPYDDLVIDIDKGVQTLDGKSAIHYVRYRDEDGDLGRIERQQVFIKAVIDKAKSPMTLARLPMIISELSSAIKTDMTTSEMLGLVPYINSISSDKLRTEMVPGTPVYIDEVNYWIPDMLEVRYIIASTQDLKEDEKWQASSRNLSYVYQESVPERAVLAGYEDDVAEEDDEAKDDEKSEDDKDDKKAKKKKDSTATKKSKDDKDKADVKEKDKEKPAQKAKSEQKAPEVTIKVDIINASGSKEAGQRVTSAMRNQGFIVTGLINSSNIKENTIVVAYADSENVTRKLASIPFDYILQISEDKSKADKITIVVGKDYLE